MKKKKIKKLKRKIWIISAIILISYITALVLKPTALTTLLPIIIPTTLLTIGIPTYAIIKSLTEILEEKNKTPTKINNDTNNQNKLEKEKNISQKTLSIKKKQLYETDYQQPQQDKPKVKTKGTRF